MSYSNFSKKEIRQWENTRSKGKAKYISLFVLPLSFIALTNPLFAFYINAIRFPNAIVTQLDSNPISTLTTLPGLTGLIVGIIISIVIGYFVGNFAWNSHESKYNRAINNTTQD